MEYPACLLHEALINLAFSGFDASILCPYDATRLAPHVLADVACTHPVLADPARQWASRSYADPTVTATRCNLPLPEPPPYARAVTYADVGALGSLRHFAQEQAVRAGLGPGQVGDFTFAVNELVTNTLEHTVGTGRLTAWTEPGLLVCQVDDEGRLADPLAGRIPPLPVQDGGRGLILVNQLCDLVRVYHRPAGTTVRIWMRTGEAG